jgi:ClpP class serine protease
MQPGAPPDFDGVRRRYLTELHALTGRPTIVYSSDWLSGGTPASSIVLKDMQGFMEVCHGLDGPELDVILHSPGGSAEAAASIVRYLRTKYQDIRVFVPLAAMSAATMLALAADRIVMGKHSQLGPIDPQLVASTGSFPARSVIDQFEQAKRECSADPSLLGAWMPILQHYGPALLNLCERHPSGR